MSDSDIKQEGNKYYLLGSLYFYGIEGFDKNINRAIIAWRMAAVRENSTAQYNLGVIYKFGHENVEENVPYGNYQLIKSAFRGNDKAKKILAEELDTAADTGFRYYDASDYMTPQSGISFRFNSDFAKLDEYHYTLGINDLTTGINHRFFDKIYNGTKNDFIKGGSIFESENVVSIANVDFKLITGRYEKDNKRFSTFSYISAVNAELLKFRITYYRAPSEAEIKNLRQFLEKRVELQKSQEAYSAGMYFDIPLTEGLPKHTESEYIMAMLRERGRQIYRAANSGNKDGKDL